MANMKPSFSFVLAPMEAHGSHNKKNRQRHARRVDFVIFFTKCASFGNVSASIHKCSRNSVVDKYIDY